MNGALVTNGVSAATVRVYWGSGDGLNVAGSWANMAEFPGAFNAGSLLTKDVTRLPPETEWSCGLALAWFGPLRCASACAILHRGAPAPAAGARF